MVPASLRDSISQRVQHIPKHFRKDVHDKELSGKQTRRKKKKKRRRRRRKEEKKKRRKRRKEKNKERNKQNKDPKEP